jgi:hypothetical protein
MARRKSSAKFQDNLQKQGVGIMAISNNYLDCEVLNLDPQDPEHGPFVVTQSAVDASDPAQRSNLYLLRRDGVWIEYATHALTPESERVPIVFDGLGEIVRLMEDLPSDPEIERDDELDQAGLANFLQQVKASGGMLAHIRQTVVRYKTQKQL